MAGKVGGGRLTGDGEAPLLPAPQGRAQGPLGGLGYPNTSLRLSGRLCPWCSEPGVPLDSGIPPVTPGPVGTLSLVLRILKRASSRIPPSAARVMGPLLSTAPLTPEEGGKGGGGGLRSPLRGRGRGRGDL